VLLAQAAKRTRTVNEAFGTHLSPQDIAANFADDDIAMLVAWMDHR
jgi:hypothetical protein